MPDGTPFRIPGDAEPVPLDVPDDTRNAIVYLALPVSRQGGAATADADRPQEFARFEALEFDAADAEDTEMPSARLKVARPRLRYILEGDDRAGLVCLSLMRITEVLPDRRVCPDNAYIPPCVTCAASEYLSNLIVKLQAALNSLGHELAKVLGQANLRGAAEISNLLLLQTINRYQPLFAHLAGGLCVHPERLYSIGLEMAGDLATFTSEKRRPPIFPIYRHDSLQQTFEPLAFELRRSLSMMPQSSIVPIPLEMRPDGIRVAIVKDPGLFAKATIVLSVRADQPPERLSQDFPKNAKIGPVENILLIDAAAPGIPIRFLQLVPRQLPVYAGSVYFEIDRNHNLFKKLPQSAGMAIQLTRPFQKVEMECWAIRDPDRAGDER
jgi:type VI secretion system protein ImpJ